MRGQQSDQPRLFFTIDVESRIRADHPLRDVKRRVDRILEGMSDLFDAAYSRMGRPSVPPERLLKALLLQALYSVRSEAQLVERIDTDLLFRWFLDMDPTDPVFDATAFTHNRPRMAEHGIMTAFFDAVVKEALDADLCSEHFSVDGTMIQSYASPKSFQPIEESEDDNTDTPGDGNSFKPRNVEVDFHGQRRTNDTHRSTTDPESRLFRKGNGKPAHLAHLGHALSENRHGLILQVCVTAATGRGERDAAIQMLDSLRERHGRRAKTVASDKGYDSGEYYMALEAREITPHGAMTPNEPKPETTRKDKVAKAEARLRMKQRQSSAGYRLSQRCRKKVEEYFGWMKCVAGLSRTRLVGRWKLKQQVEVAAAAFNLVRLLKLKPI